MFTPSNDGTGKINLNQVESIVAYSSSSSSFSLAARPATNKIKGGNDVAIGSVYTTKAAATAALNAFLNEAGFPWVGIGTIPDPVSNGVSLVAVNLAVVGSFDDSTGGTGVSFDGTVSNGYAPRANGTAAVAALLELAGEVTATP